MLQLYFRSVGKQTCGSVRQTSEPLESKDAEQLSETVNFDSALTLLENIRSSDIL